MTAIGGIGAAILGGVVAGILLALIVNFSAALARLAFDSLVQRDAPDANQGRAFAQFETKFQLAWVIGGLVPVLYGPDTDGEGPLGFAIVGAIALFAVVSYIVGTRRVAAGKPIPEPFGKRARQNLAAELERRKLKREGSTPTRGTRRPTKRATQRSGQPLPPPSPGQRPAAAGPLSDPPSAGRGVFGRQKPPPER
jgi:uncharacterized membrane protein